MVVMTAVIMLMAGLELKGALADPEPLQQGFGLVQQQLRLPQDRVATHQMGRERQA